MQINQKTELVIRKAKVEIQVMVLERSEIVYWNFKNHNPYFIFFLSDATAVVWKKKHNEMNVNYYSVFLVNAVEYLWH